MQDHTETRCSIPREVSLKREWQAWPIRSHYSWQFKQTSLQLFVSGNEDSVRRCYFLESEDSESAHYYKLFTIWAFAIGFCLPLIIISSTNYSILGHIRKGHAVNNDTQSRVHSNNRPSRDERRKKTCVIVVACTIIFAICWLPLYIFLIHVYFFANNSNSPEMATSALPENSTNSTFLSFEQSLSQLGNILDPSNATQSMIRNDSLSSNSSLTWKMDVSDEFTSESEDESLNHIRMFCLLLSYCNGMFNPIVLLIMSGNIRQNLCTCFSSTRGTATDPTHLHSRTNTRNRRRSSHIPIVRRQGGTAKMTIFMTSKL